MFIYKYVFVNIYSLYIYFQLIIYLDITIDVVILRVRFTPDVTFNFKIGQFSVSKVVRPPYLTGNFH